MLQPLNNYLIIEELVREEQTAGGIYLPEKRKSKPIMGTVFAVPKNFPALVNKGDKVWYIEWSGNPVPFKGKNLIAVHMKDLLAYEALDKMTNK